MINTFLKEWHRPCCNTWSKQLPLAYTYTYRIKDSGSALKDKEVIKGEKMRMSKAYLWIIFN
jgi:hypothetical protein